MKEPEDLVGAWWILACSALATVLKNSEEDTMGRRRRRNKKRQQAQTESRQKKHFYATVFYTKGIKPDVRSTNVGLPAER